MVHLLLCADALELEGLVSSPFGPGRAHHILEVIAEYERDFPLLRSHSPLYPQPDQLRAITKQGALDSPGAAGAGTATDGSRWIVQCARRQDPRPLHVLVWGGIEDLAQALHDAPNILPKLRVYFIGGPNKMWSIDAFEYIERNHPKLWMIEANSTYRGWFVGGRQDSGWGNESFVKEHIAGHGNLGKYFATHLRGVIKMGDTPSVAHLLYGSPEDPSQPGWGGKFVRVWSGRKATFTRHTTEADTVEQFGVVEIAIPAPPSFTPSNTARAWLDNRVPSGVAFDGKLLRFRFSPRDAKLWTYRIESDCAELQGASGKFTAVPPPSDRVGQIAETHPNWWTDDQSPEHAEGIHAGARTVSRWRVDFLTDFARRMDRCLPPGAKS
ncbi:hypothetical protein F183_A28460 [Bryobacterales bacterium F-183]|nr:hypothetical protein F183_A28460 [Bryobacterales bacterium F-183]